MLQSIYTLIGFLVFWCLCFLVACVIAVIIYRWFIDKVWASDWFMYYIKRKRFTTEKMQAAYGVLFAPFKPGIRRGSAWRYSVKLRAKNIRDAAPKYVFRYAFEERKMFIEMAIANDWRLKYNGAALFAYSKKDNALYVCDVSSDKRTNYFFIPGNYYRLVSDKIEFIGNAKTQKLFRPFELYKCYRLGALGIMFPHTIHHSANDQFVEVVNTGDYTIAAND